MLQQYLEAGKIVGTHGVRGELRVEPWCDSAEVLCRLETLYWGDDRQPVRILSARPHKNLALIKLEGVDTIEQGDALRGRILYLNRKDMNLPKDTWFIQDLLGAQVKNESTGEIYGVLSDVLHTGANDVYEVTDSQGKKYLLPAIPDVVKTVDIEGGVVEIQPMEGIFDDAD